ncbi:hypothetical protein [Paenibacillus sp. JCM 10914]|uniref:hypothetical protein n=1 Tax=Paenibacillus sp. JCM 10914 TaxID=1236974 RepID=UPI0003CCA19C|nr:hypothetical protein JCM10914_4809 [Paenibacillus sp. JCM 10914]
MIPNNYVETVYAGFIGMNIGIRLGAPIEPVAWTYERIVMCTEISETMLSHTGRLRQTMMPMDPFFSSARSMTMPWIGT